MSITAGILGATSIAGGVIGAVGSNAAAGTQASAAENAAQLQAQSAANALAFQKQVYNQTQANEAPWLQSGGGALNQLDYLMGVTPNTSLGTTGAPGAAPNAFSNTGIAAPPTTGTAIPPGGGGPMMPRSALIGTNAFSGGGPTGSPVLSGSRFMSPANGSTATGPMPTNGLRTATGPGGTLDAKNAMLNPHPGGAFGSLTQGYGAFQAPTGVTFQNDPAYQFDLQQGLRAMQNSAAASGGLLSGSTAEALSNYAQGNALNAYQQVYNNALNTYSTNYNVWNQNQTNLYNRLASMAGLGQTAAGQLAGAGANAANAFSNTALGSSANIGNALMNAGAATASGYAGMANAFSNATSGLGQAYMLNSMLGGGGVSGVPASEADLGIAPQYGYNPGIG